MPIVKIGMDVSGLRSGTAQAVSTLNGISTSAAEAQKSTNMLVSALTSAAKSVLALVGAYKTLDSIKAFAERGIAFNSAMEQSQISIGSLITSMATLEDEQGRILTGAEKYAAAQSIASDMMKEIQRLGLETTATTTELVEGVQGVMGSALNAGLNLRQIPEFAVAAAQAMQTMQIPLNQMRTEIDALLTGNITKSQDILAPRLGIDKETINSWKEQGILVEKLMEKLSAFQQAGKDVAKTWQGLTSNLNEAIDVISGQVSIRLSSALKESVSNLQDLFVTTKDGTVGISKDFQNVADVIEQTQVTIGKTILTLVNSFADGVRWLNKAIGEMGGADAALDSVKTAIVTLTAALASLKVVRSEGVRQTTQAIASEIQYAQAVASGQAVVLGSAEAHRQQAAAAVESARAENEAARAAEAEATAQLRSAQAKLQNAITARQVTEATRQQSAAQYNLAQAQERARITSVALAAAEGNLATAARIAVEQTTRGGAAITATKSLWTRASTLMVAGAAKATNAFKGLWAAMGGGVGIAITAIVTGLTYLSTRQTETERTTKILQEAQEAYAHATKNAVDETGNLTRNLSELERAEISISQGKLIPDYDKQIERISERFQRIALEMHTFARNAGFFSGELGTGLPKQYEDDLNSLISQLKNGKLAPKEFGDSLSLLREKLIQGGHEKSPIVVAIDELINGEEKVIRTLISTKAEIDRNNDVLNSHSGAIKEAAKANTDYADTIDLLDKLQQTEINDAKDAVEWLQKRTQGTDAMKASTEANARAADELALAKIREAEAVAQGTYMMAQATAAISDNQEEANKAVDEALKNWEKATKAREQFEQGLQEVYNKKPTNAKGRRGGASQIESARESIKRLQEEIDHLNGSMSKEGGGLAKKTAEIEKLGKQAKLSASEIRKLQEDYSAAFKADTLKEFDKAVLQIEGDASALRKMEIAHTMRDWGLRFADLGMSADEAAPHLERLKKALEMQEGFKDLQTAADFYKDLEALSGEYGQSIEYQNRLIEQQAELWIQAGIPLADVEKRIQLMRQDLSRDMFSGLVRGVRKFGSEYGDMAAQVEGLTTQMGNHISNSLADAFMQGKFSAQDFFNSLISMAAQAASNAFIGQIFSGIGGLFDGGTISMAQNLISYIPGLFHSGGVVGTTPRDGVRAVPASFFTNAPRLHKGGGFAADEYPAILLRGERVLNRDETRAYNAGQASGSVSAVNVNTSSPDVTVNVINQTNQNVDAQTQTRQDANGGLSLDIILKQVDSGMAGLARQGKSQFGAFIQKTYGLDRAGTIMQGRGRA